MRFENNFAVSLPPDQAWSLLLDVERIAPCLPGAKLTESLGEGRYKGEAAVKIGPVMLKFAGMAQMADVNAQNKTARVTAKGADSSGRGNASATVDFSLAPEGSGSRVNLVTDLNLVGSIAQYGRATGIVKEIAGQLIGQFATNLEGVIARSSAKAPTPQFSVAEAQLSVAKTVSIAETEPVLETQPGLPVEPQRQAPPPSEPQVAISGIRLLLVALGNIVKRWFGGRSGGGR
jgi:carbon monoxide dehydrogenase subunit G